MTLQSILLAAAAAGMLGAATGAMLLLLPRRVIQSDSRFRRVLLETHLGHLFNRRFAIERRIYRRHRWFAALVMLGGIALASLLWILAREPSASNWLHGSLGKLGARAALAMGLAIDVLLFVVGACLWARPSVLKGIEAAANRWIDPIPSRSSSELVCEFVARSPRLTGALLVVAGVACLRPF